MIRDPWLAELARYKRACGCEVSAAFAVVALVGDTALQVMYASRLTVSSLLIAALQILIVAIAAALIGKLTGLGVARIRYERATTRLINQLTDYKAAHP